MNTSGPWWRLIASALLALLVGTGRADTVQNFDTAGTAFELAQNNVNPPPAVTPGGPTGNFLRLASASAQQNVNTVAFTKSDAGTYRRITAEFDFHITGQADGMSFA